MLEHKSDNISETRKDRGKVTMEGLYRNSPTLFRTVPSPTPYRLLFPKIGCSQPPLQNPKTPINIISGTREATDFKFGQNIYRLHPNNTFFEERERGRIQGLPIFWIAQLFQQQVKLRTSSLAGTFTGSIQTEVHLKLLEKEAWAYPGTAQIFKYSPIMSGTDKARNF